MIDKRDIQIDSYECCIAQLNSMIGIYRQINIYKLIVDKREIQIDRYECYIAQFNSWREKYRQINKYK